MFLRFISLIVPIFVGDLGVSAGEGAFEESAIAHEVPIAVLIKLAAGGDEWGRPDRAPFLAESLAVIAEAAGEVDVLDRDEVGIESADGVEGLPRGPKGGVGKTVFDDVGNDHEGAADDAEGPSLREDEGAAADKVLVEFFEDEAEEVRVESGVGIDGYNDLAGGGGDPSITNAGEVFGIFEDEDGSGCARDLLGAVGAAVEDHDGFDLAGADLDRFLYGGEASGEVIFFVVCGDDD